MKLVTLFLQLTMKKINIKKIKILLRIKKAIFEQ